MLLWFHSCLQTGDTVTGQLPTGDWRQEQAVVRLCHGGGGTENRGARWLRGVEMKADGCCTRRFW